MRRAKSKIMKSTTAQCYLTVLCSCPHCPWPVPFAPVLIDITDKAKQHLANDLRAKDISLEIACPDCGNFFEVTEITY